MKKTLSLALSVIMVFCATFAMPSAMSAASAPKATSITKLTANVKGFTVKWKKVSGAGYQIQYSTSKKFTNAKKISVKASKTSRKVTKLKAKKKYYVRVRTSKNGKYSSWSKVKSVTTKGSSNKAPTPHGTVVYITPTGKKYHYSKSCAGPNAIKKNLSEVKGKYGPCKKCAC